MYSLIINIIIVITKLIVNTTYLLNIINMVWHSKVNNNKNLKLNSNNEDEKKEKEILYSKNKSFFLLLKILNVYPLFFEINIQNLIQTLTDYYQERLLNSSSQHVLDCIRFIYIIIQL